MRIKVLVAEDEAPIMRSICASITRVNLNFEVVATASNGRKAMELINEMPDIQVVFLDINMPVVNGIQLLEFMQAHHPHILPVVLSGYQNFDYAQKALRYGAKSYLLKPLRTKELEEVLDELQEQVIAENERQLALLIRDLPLQERVMLQNDRLSYLAAVFIGSFRMVTRGMKPTREQEETEAAIRQFLDGAYGEGNYCLASDGRYAAKILLINDIAHRPWEWIVGLFDALKKDVFSVPVTVVLREEPVPFSQVSNVHYLMRLLAWREMAYDKSSILWLPLDASMENLQQSERSYDALFACFMDETTRDEALELYKNALYAQANTRTEVLRLTKCFFSAVFALPACSSSYFDVEEAVMDAVEGSYTREVLLEKATALLVEYWKENQNASLSKEQLAQMMEQYLQSHMEQPITLETLERKFGYTAAYLREIFRSLYDISPQEYLLQLRIARAKQMLKAGIAAKSVAQAVGFSDPLYFSKVFKKQTGVTPSAYKNEAGV